MGGRVVSGVCAESGASDRARLTLKAIVALLTTGENTTLLLVLGHGDWWELGGGVVLSSVVVDLVDWDGGVHNVRLDGLLVHNRLDGLVDVLGGMLVEVVHAARLQCTHVVDVLARDGGASGAGLVSLNTSGGVLELSTLLRQATLVLLGVIMLEGAVLDGNDVVVVCLGKDLLIGDGLDGGVVVVLEDEESVVVPE